MALTLPTEFDTILPRNSKSLSACLYHNSISIRHDLLIYIDEKCFFPSPLDFLHVVNLKVAKGNVNITWLPTFKGECHVSGYLVYYREVSSEVSTGQWNVVNVSQYNATNHNLQLRCYMEYEITVNTQNANGDTPLNRSKLWKVKTGGGKYS